MAHNTVGTASRRSRIHSGRPVGARFRLRRAAAVACAGVAARAGGIFSKKERCDAGLLADDVLGELDPVRRRRFWAALASETQVIATGTSLPEEEEADAWQVMVVRGGEFSETGARTEKIS